MVRVLRVKSIDSYSKSKTYISLRKIQKEDHEEISKGK